MSPENHLATLNEMNYTELYLGSAGLASEPNLSKAVKIGYKDTLISMLVW